MTQGLYFSTVGDHHAPQVAIIDCSPRFLKIVLRTIFTVLCTAASRPRFDGEKTGTANLNNNDTIPFYLVIQSLEVIVLPLGAITLRRGIPPHGTSYYPYSIPLLLLALIHPGVARNFRNFPLSRGAREFIYSYLSTARLFHKRFPRLFALSFIFYKVNEIVPPPRFCQPFSLVFPRFFNFCRFCGSFSAIFAFPNKKLSTAHRLWITRFFILQAMPLAAFVYKKSAATAVTARKTQIPIVAKQPLCKRLVQRKHKKNLHFYRKHRFSRTKKDGKRFAIDFS